MKFGPRLASFSALISTATEAYDLPNSRAILLVQGLLSDIRPSASNVNGSPNVRESGSKWSRELAQWRTETLPEDIRHNHKA